MLPVRSPPNLERMRLSVCTDLPAEIFYSIFSQLDDPRDLHRSSLVCKEWRSAATDDRLWESYFWAFYRPIDGEKKLQQYYTRKKRAGMRAWLKQASAATQIVAAREVPMPPFLLKMAKSTIQFPNFNLLFSSRLNADDRLLYQLHRLVQSSCHTLDGLSKIIGEHQDRARPLFAALVATQAIDHDDVGDFLPPSPFDSDDDTSWPRALDVHTAAAQGRKLPNKTHCLTLYLTALKTLGHLQRREGIASLQNLRNNHESFGPTGESGSSISRDRILKCCKGVENAMNDVALFRSGEKRDAREYLDLLALYVWADLHAGQYGAAFAAEANSQALPTGSTRLLLSRIIISLRTLGYQTAKKPTLQDVDNSFVNLALYCAIQRETSPLTFASIICSVARRLGVAATISSIIPGVFIMAVEDLPEPASWRDEHDKTAWPRFWVDVRDDAPWQIREKTEVIHYIRRYRDGKCEGEELRDLLQPASPLNVLMIVAGLLLNYATQSRPPLTRRGAQHCSETILGGSTLALAQADQLRKLRLFLEGRDKQPPRPLLPPKLLSSLASIPPTAPGHAVSKRADHYSQDAVYCARWILGLISPDSIGGLDAANESLAPTIASSDCGSFSLDYALVIELDRQRWGMGAASGLKGIPKAPAEWSQSRSAPDWFTKFFRPFLEQDTKTAIGLGGAGSFDLDLPGRPLGVTLPRQFLDHSHQANSSVKLRVGAVIQHRIQGRKGVIVGWDAACRESERLMEGTAVDELVRLLGRQPHYHIIMDDMSECYEAQSFLQPIKVPAGASRKEAVAILRELVPLCNVRSLGKAFRTLAVERWAETKAETGEGGKGGEMEKGLRGKAEQDVKVGLRRDPGQVYLVMNAWMREAWPYD